MSFSPAKPDLNRELVTLQDKIKSLEESNIKLEAERLRFKSYHDMAFGYAQNYKDQLEAFEKNLKDKELLYQETKAENFQLTNELKSSKDYLVVVKQEYLDKQQLDEDVIDQHEKYIESKQEIINDLNIQLKVQTDSNNEYDKLIQVLKNELDIFKAQMDEKNMIINELELNLSNEKISHLEKTNELEKYSIDLEINYLKQLKLKDDHFKNEIKQFQAKECSIKLLEEHLKKSYEMVKDLSLKPHLSPNSAESVPEKRSIDKRKSKTKTKDNKFSDKTNSFLIQMFDENRYPSKETIAKIKKETNLQDNQIIKWFSN